MKRKPSFTEELKFLAKKEALGSSHFYTPEGPSTPFLPIVGMDEVGRGCLAGPVVVAAVAFCLEEFEAWQKCQNSRQRKKLWFSEVNDSKLLLPEKRKELSLRILEKCAVQIAWAMPEHIDERNILWACFDAMREALWPFSGLVSTLLVDGHLNPLSPRYGAPEGFAEKVGISKVETLIKGDSRSFSIAAASIVAKVFRDEWMEELHKDFAHYGWNQNRGYPTKLHREGLRKFGLSPWHRRSFTMDLKSGLE